VYRIPRVNIPVPYYTCGGNKRKINFRLHMMKLNGRINVYFHVFLTSVLDGNEFSASYPGRFIPDRKPAEPVG
jgi:hypothetical protein